MKKVQRWSAQNTSDSFALSYNRIECSGMNQVIYIYTQNCTVGDATKGQKVLPGTACVLCFLFVCHHVYCRDKGSVQNTKAQVCFRSGHFQKEFTRHNGSTVWKQCDILGNTQQKVSLMYQRCFPFRQECPVCLIEYLIHNEDSLLYRMLYVKCIQSLVSYIGYHFLRAIYNFVMCVLFRKVKESVS